ncbi:hypothetical protein K6X10_20515, partial [Xanthomonas euvesicatoria pv. allii]|nr:hypothetical protein [Xanthomonas euvesicatoria pv. allii]
AVPVTWLATAAVPTAVDVAAGVMLPSIAAVGVPCTAAVALPAVLATLLDISLTAVAATAGTVAVRSDAVRAAVLVGVLPLRASSSLTLLSNAVNAAPTLL